MLMNKSVLSVWHRSVAVALVIALAACGGGGGNSSAPTTVADTTGTTTTTTGTTTASSSSPTITLAIYNAASTVVSDVTTGAVFTARAVVLDPAGSPVANTRVDFATGDSNLSLSRYSDTTDALGQVDVVVSPSASSTGGGVTLTATATVGGVVKTQSVNFNVGSGVSSTAAPSITVGVYRVATGVQVYSVSYSEAFEARATLLNASGQPVANELVSFNLGAYTSASVTPTELVTNASGVAAVTIRPSSISATGGATLTATATVGATSVSNKTSFNVASSNVSLSAISVGSPNIAAGGNTSLSVTVSVGGSVASGVPINVTYSASCGRINGGTTSASVTTNGSGVASASYESVNSDGSLCGGPVTITASSAGATSTTATITVATAIANAVTFVSSVTPVQIFVAGSGALEQYVAQFKVLAGTTPMANQSVTFSLQVNPGGVGLDSTGLTANVVKTTDSSGIAKVTIFSGTLPGAVRVRAALTATPTVFAETQNLTVASGPASQRFMSLSVSTPNIEGWAIDGTSTRFTARVADRQGNAVEDGTVVNFTTEAGQVAYSCSTLKANNISSCSVDFMSQNPRPSGGRVSVLAFLEGTKDYTDIDGNNKYDAGTDTLVSIGDAYRDDNENGMYDSGEFVIGRGGSGVCAGSGGSFPARVNTCDTNLSTTVRQHAVILYSSSVPNLVVTSGPNVGGISFTLASMNNTLLPMPAGTTVTAQASGQSVVLGATVYCAVDKIYGPSVPNVFPTIDSVGASLATSHSVTLKDCASGANNSVSITVTAPSGLATTYVYTIP